jgi:hypothetical protein
VSYALIAASVENSKSIVDTGAMHVKGKEPASFILNTPVITSS